MDGTGSPTRRDFVVVMAGAFVAVGGGFAVWPLIDQMNPNPATREPEVTRVDLERIPVGEEITVIWKRMPVLVRHRRQSEIERAIERAKLSLIDAYARNARLPENAPASDENRRDPEHAEWLVVVGLCQKEGCKLSPGDGDLAWMCQCCGSRFDHAGRLSSGPAGINLRVPPYRFVSANLLEIGGDEAVRS
jgi:ubiquinol-cytochrome c reductase iron-sulfur subunit